MEVLLEQGDATVTSLNVAEAVDVACRVYRAREQTLREAIELLVAARLLLVTAPDVTAGFRAAHLRITHYRRRECPLSLADCFLLAAVRPRDRVATADPSVAQIARLENIALVSLPDSTGRRP